MFSSPGKHRFIGGIIHLSEFKISNSNEDNFEIIFLFFFIKNTFCDSSIEKSCRDGSNDDTTAFISMENLEDNSQIIQVHIFLSGATDVSKEGTTTIKRV